MAKKSKVKKPEPNLKRFETLASGGADRIVYSADGDEKHYEFNVQPEDGNDYDRKILFVAILAIVVRALLAPHPYSGYNQPPMYGDFEAQRHWQEIGLNILPDYWYVNSTENDLNYWGMDYPPLTGLHSLLMGWFAHRFVNESYVALGTSRGLTDDGHKIWMRLTVLLADAAIYVPAILSACSAVFQYIWTHRGTARGYRLLHVVVFALYPGQILIDNGHFQYNNISLGLFLNAVTNLLKGNMIFAPTWFALALNYKQMELYHALPIFVLILARIFKGMNVRHYEWDKFPILGRFLLVGALVSMVFAGLWAPFVFNLPAVIRRVFPVARGVFEDKVANVWFALNCVVRIK